MILDTNAISSILEGEPAIESVLEQAERHHLPVIALGEYRFGLRSSKRRTRLEVLLNLLVAESVVVAVDAETTVHYADVRAELRTAGSPIPENDVWIAALARQHQLPIVTRDAHFDAVRGVRRISW